MKKLRILSISTIFKSALSVLLVALLPVSSVMAVDFDLVTLGEYTESVNAGENPQFDFLPKAVPGGPRINVLAPVDATVSLTSPVDIDVAFESADGSSIDMSSLRIFYLMFIKKDVTKRLLEHATVDSNSISAKGAKLPAGEHKFLIEISDSEKRLSRQKIIVKVGS